MNVLVICVDTLRWDHLGINAGPPVRTPCIDRLAEHAIAFDRCIISSFPTNPMRVDSFTGNCNFPRYGWQALNDDEIVLSELMGEAGYTTGLIFDHTPMHGVTRGFHEVHQTFRPGPGSVTPEEVPFPCPKEHLREDGKWRQRFMAELAGARHEQDFWVPGCMLRAAEWLEDNAGRDRWMLWVDTWEPHETWHTPAYYVDMYDPGYEGIDYDDPNYGYASIYTEAELRHLWAHYAAEVTMTDRWIGHLLNQLDVMELWDTTLLVLISDHGTYIGEHGRTGKHTIRGDDDPWPLYEEVTRIPLLVRVPGAERGKRLSALTQPPDLAPTILDICGVKAPEMYGRSWRPLLTGESLSGWDRVYSSTHCGARARDIIYPTRLTVTTPDWTLVAEEPGRPVELYDIRRDAKQQHDVAAEHPDVVNAVQQDVVAFMRSQDADDDYVRRFEVR